MALNYHALPVEVESVSNVTLTNSVDLGTVRVFAGEEYVYVYNDSTGPIYPGYGLTMSGNTGFSVTLSATTYYAVCVGIVKHSTMLTAQYGWALTKGFTNVKMHASSSGLVQGPLLLSKDGVFVDASGTYINTAGTAFSQATTLYGVQCCGVIVQATASAGVAYAFVKCFGA